MELGANVKELNLDLYLVLSPYREFAQCEYRGLVPQAGSMGPGETVHLGESCVKLHDHNRDHIMSYL